MVNLRHKLNHTINHLDSILDYTQIPRTDDEIIKEYPYLQHIVELLGKEIKTALRRLDETQEELERVSYMVENSTGTDKDDAISDYNKTLKQARNYVYLINDLLVQIDSPYFGRVDFKRNRTETFPEAVIKSYIGKFAYFDPQTRQSLITDWRAPIANLYYNNAGPVKNVAFTSPLGVQSGDLIKKAQYDITAGRIINIYDAQTGNASADAYLLSQLNKKIGKKLSDIVSTIQDLQNTIIREKTDRPVIIQGVAGSGKTTILLHRIAYLLYDKTKGINPENSLIIAPNKMFLDYISDVLPSLGVHDIGKNTYLYWAKTVLGWDDKYLLSSEKDNLFVKEFKGSTEFIQIVNDFMNDFEEDLMDKITKGLPSRIVLRIKQRYSTLKAEASFLSIEERANLAVEYSFAQEQFNNKTTGNFMGNLERQQQKVRELKLMIRRRTNVTSLYTELFKFAYIYKGRGLTDKQIKELREHTLKTLVKKKSSIYFKAEDLAPMVLIHFKLFGYKEFMKDYIAVDEAQDLSLFQLLTLYAISKNSNITIAGDLAQSIVPPFYIKDWNDLIELLGNDSYYHQLDKCYRTTVEIIEFANTILRSISQNRTSCRKLFCVMAKLLKQLHSLNRYTWVKQRMSPRFLKQLIHSLKKVRSRVLWFVGTLVTQTKYLLNSRKLKQRFHDHFLHTTRKITMKAFLYYQLSAQKASSLTQ